MHQMSESLIHESISQSHQENRGTGLIMESKVIPVRFGESNKVNQLQSGFVRTGKTIINSLQNKMDSQKRTNIQQARPQTASKIVQPQISIDRNIPQSKPTLMDRQQFMQYYEENIQLKNNKKQMQLKINILKNQLNQISHVRQAQNHRELELLSTGKKPTLKEHHQKYNPHINNNKKGESQKVTNLLQIIEHYKAKLGTSQDQITNLKRQKHLLEQDTRLKEKKNTQIFQNFHNTSKKQNIAELQERLISTTKLLQIEKQRNKYNEADVKRLQTKIRAQETNKQQFEYLRQQNRSLEQQLMKLTQVSSFSKVTDKVDEQRRVKELEHELKTMKEKYSKLKNQSIKNQADARVLKDELIRVHVECDSFQKENMKLNDAFSGNSILSKLAEDKQLLEEVVYEMQKKKSKIQIKSSLQKQNYQKIVMEKQMLANELTNLRSKVASMQQNWKQKERMSKIEKEQLVSTYKQQAGSSLKVNQGRIMSKNGVAYTDDVSMFTQDIQNIPQNSNYFDLFLGQLHLLETMISTTFSMRGNENTLILATIDFYNHNTETTRPVHGIHSNLQSQFSFKVTQDEFFFKYLGKSSFNIQIWGSQGNKRTLLGRATVDLKALVSKSRKNMAPVVSSSMPLYVNQKVMGSVNFVMRLRLPIFQQLQKITELDQIVSSENSTVRRLIIQIEQGRGFPQSSNTFVYFPFRLQDYFTKTYKGSTPAWNYYKTIELKYNTDLKNYLRKNELQFIIMDDNSSIANEHLGLGRISLIPLLESKVIRERLAVMKGTLRVGQIDVKIYWHETEAIGEIALEQSSNIEDIISKYLLDNKMQPEDIFGKIDKNRTGMISFQQFFTWVLKIDSRITLDLANNYYKNFRHPVNSTNFSNRLQASKQTHVSQMAKQLSEINKMMSQNTELIKKRQTLFEYLKDKDVMTVCLDMDASYDGKISRQQLKTYFDAHNIELPTDLMEKEQIEIVKLMKKYQTLR